MVWKTGIWCVSVLALVSFGAAQAAEVQMEKVPYGGWNNCIKLTNGSIELIVTTDVGPRVIRVGFVGGPNLFHEYPEALGKTGGDKWCNYGGHRFWHAPESDPRTYWPDNGPVENTWDGKVLKLTQPVEGTTGLQKVIEISLEADKDHVTINHTLINHNLWDVETAPWSISVMAGNGRVIFPQEPYRPHPDYLLPARPLVLWHYTNMADPRWTWSEKYVQCRQDPKSTAKQKIGFLNKQGWAAYTLEGDVFIKRFAYQEGAEYLDYGVNNEMYVDKDMLEIESLAPVSKIPASGGSASHQEDWYIFKAQVGTTDADIDKQVLPLVQKTTGK